MEVLQRLEKQMDSQSLDPSTESADMIRRMLSMGVYRYLKRPLPSCIAEDSSDAPLVRKWHAHTTSIRTKKVQSFCVLCSVQTQFYLFLQATPRCTMPVPPTHLHHHAGHQ